MKGASQYNWTFLAILLGIMFLFAAALLFEDGSKDNFSLDRTNCKTALAPGKDCQIYINFHPEQDGEANGLIKIKTSNGERRISISGFGKSSSVSAEGGKNPETDLAIKQNSLQLYTLKNQGLTSVDIKEPPLVSDQNKDQRLIYIALIVGISLLVFGSTSLFYIRQERR